MVEAKRDQNDDNYAKFKAHVAKESNKEAVGLALIKTTLSKNALRDAY